MSGWMAGLANHLWQTTAVVGVIWVMTLALSKNQARVRSALWLAASLKFLLPFSLLVTLGGVLPRPQRPPAAPAVYATVDEMALPFDSGTLTENFVASDSVAEKRHGAPDWIAVVLGGIWLCGAVAVLVVWARRWQRVRRTLRRARLAEDGREFELLRRVQQRMGGRVSLALRMSDEWMEPGICGLFRPVLMWPEQLSERLDDDHIEAILIHELAHALQRDNLIAAVHMLVEVLFWFHPAVWWLERRMIEERERACDEAVVAVAGRPGIYAESLLKAVRFCIESPLSCAAGITGADLSKRVRSIMTLRLEPLTLSRMTMLIAFLVVMISAPVGFGVARMVPIYAQVLHHTGALPAYEVVVIKPSQDVMHGAASTGEQTHYSINAKLLIQFAYGVFVPGKIASLAVVGGPDWINTDVFDILAKMDSTEWTASQNMNRSQRHEQRQLMEQSMLADRFKLKMHTEMQDQPVYALTVSRGGPKLTPAKDVTGGAHVNPNPGSMTPEELKRGLIVQRRGQGFVMTVKGMKMSDLVDALMQQKEASDRPVVDQTGLAGAYDFTLVWGPAETSAPEGSEVEEAPLFTAIQQQLGLKLVNSKAPAEAVVIDHIEKPVFDEAEINR